MEKSIPGIDMTLGIRQTGGCQTLYMRFLKHFPQDDTFKKLEAALEDENIEQAFLCAHTLKGLTQQLGILSLAEPTLALCDLLRARNPQMIPAARAIFDAASPIYMRIVRDIIRLL